MTEQLHGCHLLTKLTSYIFCLLVEIYIRCGDFYCNMYSCNSLCCEIMNETLLWPGMPPWSGVEEAEVVKRVGTGETLPAVSDSCPSLITYLTQYGLKWNSHERELDLQEIHTMLRSLRVSITSF